MSSRLLFRPPLQRSSTSQLNDRAVNVVLIWLPHGSHPPLEKRFVTALAVQTIHPARLPASRAFDSHPASERQYPRREIPPVNAARLQPTFAKAQAVRDDLRRARPQLRVRFLVRKACLEASGYRSAVPSVLPCCQSTEHSCAAVKQLSINGIADERDAHHRRLGERNENNRQDVATF
jgi:hypothetical protein